MTQRCTLFSRWLLLAVLCVGACSPSQRGDATTTAQALPASSEAAARAPATRVEGASSAPASTLIAEEPTEVYGPEGAEIRLRLGNGGAGPTGVLRALAEDYLKATGQTFGIAWHQTITRLTLTNLRNKRIDVSFTYEPELEAQAVREGWASHLSRVFNDHFIIVGPRTNPAALGEKVQNDALSAFRAIFAAASTQRAGFLSRHDLSGTNVKERSLWSAIGQKPWQDLPNWYVTHQTFPAPALVEADTRGLYHITDRGTFLSTKAQLKNTVVYAQGGEILLNPCSAMLQAEPSELALDFMRYLTGARAQALIAKFGADRFDGEALFTPAAQMDFERPLVE